MVDISRTTLWTLVGIQVIIFVCLYALSWRVATLEGSHEEPKEQRE